jgi:hypothetical protein
VDTKSALIDRFGEDKVKELNSSLQEIGLLLIDLDSERRVQVLVTNGFSNYEMPVPEKLNTRRRAELYFCLPSYWDLNDKENQNATWVFDWILRIANYAKEKNTWIGSGHTFSAGSEGGSISGTMKQDHFILLDPVLLAEELVPLEREEEVLHFLAIVPIFSDEWDYKQGKGTLKLTRKLLAKGVTEKLDDFRTTVLKSKWRIW